MMGELINVFSKIVRVLKLGYKSSHAGGGVIMVDLIDKFQNRKFVRISAVKDFSRWHVFW